MAAPIAAMAAIAAASAIAQAYTAEQARGATRDQLEAMKRDFDQIIPPDLGVEVWDDPAIIQSLPAPVFDMSAITPEALQMIGRYNPQVAEFVMQEAPQLVVASEAAQEGRNAQLDALRRYMQTSQMGYDPTLEAGLYDASQRAGSMAQSRQESVMQDAARRGVLGSGIEMAANLQGGAEAADRMAMEAQQAALAQYRAKQQALAGQASLGGQIRSSEMIEAGRNADIINRFNQNATTRHQNYLQGVADLNNRAQLTNLQAEQSLANANTEARNIANIRNQEYRNNILGKQYDHAANERSNRQNMLRNKYSAADSQFDNQMDIIRGKHGIGSAGIKYGREDAADRNKQFQSLGDYGQGIVYSKTYNPELWEEDDANNN